MARPTSAPDRPRRPHVARAGAIALALTSALVASLGTAPGAAATAKVVAKRTLAPGVVYKRIDDRAWPIRTYMIRFSPDTAATLDGVLSGPVMGSYARTSTLGSRVGAIAAINGDLNSSPGRPTHQYVLDGRLIQTGKRAGISFGYRRNEHGGTVGHHPLRIRVTNPATKSSFFVSSWSGRAPGSNQIVGYTPYGGSTATTATQQCSARLRRPTPPRYNVGRNGVSRTYVVDAVRCSSTTRMQVEKGTVVLTARDGGAGKTFLQTFQVGMRARVAWRAKMPGVLDVVSGNAKLLSDRIVRWAPDCPTHMCSRNPRTAIGITATGVVVLLVVDGRDSGSIGLTLNQLAKWMRRLGVVDAVNLDGGGSATMWIAGRGVVNHPTDSSGERPVSNAIVVLPGADPNEVAPLQPRIVP